MGSGGAPKHTILVRLHLTGFALSQEPMMMNCTFFLSLSFLLNGAREQSNETTPTEDSKRLVLKLICVGKKATGKTSKREEKKEGVFFFERMNER